MTSQMTKELFEEKISDLSEFKFKGDKPVLIDFYADWCGPCKMVSPVVDALSSEYEGKIDMYKVNTDQEQELSAAFGIQSIPSFLFIPLSGQPQMVKGAIPKTTFKQAFKDLFDIA